MIHHSEIKITRDFILNELRIKLPNPFIKPPCGVTRLLTQDASIRDEYLTKLLRIADAIETINKPIKNLGAPVVGIFHPTN
ncbi:MAG: hypothetical protein ACMUEM_00640 [Flavobacteriales bacterium AspAUS03]